MRPRGGRQTAKRLAELDLSAGKTARIDQRDGRRIPEKLPRLAGVGGAFDVMAQARQQPVQLGATFRIGLQQKDSHPGRISRYGIGCELLCADA